MKDKSVSEKFIKYKIEIAKINRSKHAGDYQGEPENREQWAYMSGYLAALYELLEVVK